MNRREQGSLAVRDSRNNFATRSSPGPAQQVVFDFTLPMATQSSLGGVFRIARLPVGRGLERFGKEALLKVRKE